MRATDLIEKKKQGGSLTEDEISFLINGYVQGTVPDYQMAAFCMVVYFQGMTAAETAYLTMAMAGSGDQADLSFISGLAVDKHSTGGVADTTTLVLAPLVASAGVYVAKMSGRGLGHTGGTIDKLESIPGLKTALDQESFIRQVREIRLAVVSQTGNMVPADKKLYALRDVTATVDAIPLIAASVMSKKIAAGARAIVLDVKTGQGAFMKEQEKAFKLAAAMVEIGRQVGRETVAVVTDMNEPLGGAIGNALEVEEAIRTLRGRNRGPLRQLSLALGSYMLSLAEPGLSLQEAYARLEQKLASGEALQKLAQMIRAQGGNGAVTENTALLPQARLQHIVRAEQAGYLFIRDAQALGMAAMVLGAGRETKEAQIDLAVGLRMHGRTGDPVGKGSPLVTVCYNDERRLAVALPRLNQALAVQPEKPPVNPLIYGVVTAQGRAESPF